MRKTHNKDLPFIKEDWKGNLIDKNNRYTNLDGPSAKGFFEVLKWQLGSNKYASQKKDQMTNVKVVKNNEFLTADRDHFTWLGHATFLFQFKGVKIITDPILHTIWPLKRYTDLPCQSEDLVDIDVILLSHCHRDHADKKSMKQIANQNPNAVIYTGLGIGKLLRSWGIGNEIIEAGWYQEFPLFKDIINIQYLPAKHWNRRFLHDLNYALWGSFIIHFDDKSVYFGADSGYGSHFKEIGKMFDIDLTFLGIGAYEPIWFMHPSHTSPQDVLKVKEELNANLLVPMHFGTFDLSDEPIFNPKAELQKLTLNREDVLITDVGHVNYLSLLFQ